MADALDHAPPRLALWGAAAIVAATFAAAVLAKTTDIGASRTAEQAVVQSRMLRIVNAPDFSATVTDPVDGRVLMVAKIGPEEGFVWGLVNGLSYGRKLHGIGMDAPYELIRRADGSLMLNDPATRQTVRLKAFGTGNAAIFERLLEHKEAAR